MNGSANLKLLVKSMLAVFSAIVVLVILVLWIVIPYEVNDNNMEPTLKPNDRLLINKLAPRFNHIQHEDMIVYQADHQFYVGRVIGAPGQSVEYKKGQLYLDHTPVSESYLQTDDTATWSLNSLPNSESDIIPPNHYLVLNDVRGNKQDSRTFGLIDNAKVEGTIGLRYYPFDRMTTYF